MIHIGKPRIKKLKEVINPYNARPISPEMEALKHRGCKFNRIEVNLLYNTHHSGLRIYVTVSAAAVESVKRQCICKLWCPSLQRLSVQMHAALHSPSTAQQGH